MQILELCALPSCSFCWSHFQWLLMPAAGTASATGPLSMSCLLKSEFTMNKTECKPSPSTGPISTKSSNKASMRLLWIERVRTKQWPQSSANRTRLLAIRCWPSSLGSARMDLRLNAVDCALLTPLSSDSAC